MNTTVDFSSDLAFNPFKQQVFLKDPQQAVCLNVLAPTGTSFSSIEWACCDLAFDPGDDPLPDEDQPSDCAIS